MDKLLEHIGKSARGANLRANVDPARAQLEYVESFRSDRAPNPQDYRMQLAYPRPVILAVMSWVLREEGFDLGSGADFARGIIRGRLDREYDGKEGILARMPRRGERLHLSFDVDLTVQDDGSTLVQTSRLLPTWAEEFQARARHLLANTPPHILALVPPGSAASPQAVPQPAVPGANIADSTDNAIRSSAHVLGPGEELKQPIRGNLLDYSGFASEEELSDLGKGNLPLGCYAFAPLRGKSLYLSSYRTGAPMIYNGALICAPQNSGKTELILRWALAANRAGYSVFLVDVKGNMRAKIGDRLCGKVRYFSTDPRVADCDRINFLSELKGFTPLDGMRIRQLAEALLPREGWEEGEQAFFYQNHVNWLSGLMHILLLHQHYLPEQFAGGKANLSHLYELASNEKTLYRVMTNIAVMEERAVKAGNEPAWPGLSYWMNEISLLIDSARGGERSGEYTYRTLTQSIVNSLRPFSRFGTLYRKIGGDGDSDGARAGLGPFFSFEDLNDQNEPVTIILAAREQDLDDATTVVSMAVKKLQQFLFDRMSLRSPRPVLLLLDETRRIRNFKANQYITFAREAKAGCVIVYQSLDQIGELPQITEILENIGTQIYLGSLVGNTAKYFIEMLPARYRPTYSEHASFGTDGLSNTVQVGQEHISYVTSNELYRLPGGKWPALVYINDQPRRKPFLVDLDKDLVET